MTKFESLVNKMLADPEMTGDRLLLGIGLAKVASETPGTRVELGAVRQVLGVDPWWVRHVLVKDAPRYEPASSYPLTCRGQMIRRPGLCGQRATNRYWHYFSPQTGEYEEIGACSRHRLEVEHLAHGSRGLWIEAGKPAPPGNTGGVLEGYFGGAWDKVYEWASPRWVRPPQGVVRTDMRPVLRLIIGGLQG